MNSSYSKKASFISNSQLADINNYYLESSFNKEIKREKETNGCDESKSAYLKIYHFYDEFKRFLTSSTSGYVMEKRIVYIFFIFLDLFFKTFMNLKYILTLFGGSIWFLFVSFPGAKISLLCICIVFISVKAKKFRYYFNMKYALERISNFQRDHSIVEEFSKKIIDDTRNFSDSRIEECIFLTHPKLECLLLELKEKIQIQVPEVNLSLTPYGMDESSIVLEHFSDNEFYITTEKKSLENFFHPIIGCFRRCLIEKRDSVSSNSTIDHLLSVNSSTTTSTQLSPQLHSTKKKIKETYVFSAEKLFEEIKFDRSASEVVIRTSKYTQRFSMKKCITIRCKWPYLCKRWLDLVSKFLPPKLYQDILNCGILLANSEIKDKLTWNVIFDEVAIKLLNYFSKIQPNLIKAYTIVLFTIYQQLKEERKDKLIKNLRQQLRTIVLDLAFKINNFGSIEENSLIILKLYAKCLKEQHLYCFFMNKNNDLLKNYYKKDVQDCFEIVTQITHCFPYFILKYYWNFIEIYSNS